MGDCEPPVVLVVSRLADSFSANLPEILHLQNPFQSLIVIENKNAARKRDYMLDGPSPTMEPR